MDLKTKKWFNDLQYDTIFWYQDKQYQKVPLMFEGCCSPKFNALEVGNPEGFLYLTNYTEVEIRNNNV